MKLLLLLAVIGAVAAAETPSPALLVLNKDEATLSIVDPATGKIVGHASTGEGPHEVAASADGRFAFVGNYGGRIPGNTISVIDLTSQKEVRRVDLGPLRRPHGITFADGKVYFTGRGEQADWPLRSRRQSSGLAAWHWPEYNAHGHCQSG